MSAPDSGRAVAKLSGGACKLCVTCTQVQSVCRITPRCLPQCASPGCLSCKKNYALCDAGGCQNGLPGAGERGWGRNSAAKRPADQCLPVRLWMA